MASGEQQPSQWSFECLLANLQGSNPSQSNPSQSPAKKRFELIQPFLHHDVILLQEVSIKKKLRTRTGYHKLLDKCEAGILLNETKFVLHICTDEYLKSIIDGADDLDVVSKDFKGQLERMCIVKAIQNKGNNSVLIVSYHGPTKNKNKPIKKKKKKKDEEKNKEQQKTTYKRMALDHYCKLYTSLVKAWCFIQKGVDAQHLVIGGDFNFPVNEFREMVHYSEHGLKVYAQENRTKHRKDKRKTRDDDDTDKDIIDYFVVSERVELMECVMAQIYDHDPQTLDDYFDHDPIVAKFTVSASTTDHLAHVMQKLSLVSGPSAMARKAAIYDMQKTHFETVLQKLKSTCPKKWNDVTSEQLSLILQSSEEIEKRLDTEELRAILQYLKINLPDLSEITKNVYINALTHAETSEFESEEVKEVLEILEKASMVPSEWKKRSKQKKVSGILQNREKLQELSTSQLTEIADCILDHLGDDCEVEDKERDMLIDILYQVYQWPLSRMILRSKPSHKELHEEYEGLNISQQMDGGETEQ